MMYVLFFILGITIGSYLNVLAYRIPLEIETYKGDSFCPNCKQKIHKYDLIPVLSYIILKGKCRRCKEKISVSYPITEIIVGLLYLFLYLRFGLSIDLVIYLVIFSVMVVIIKIDYEHKYIPDRFIVIILVFGLLYTIYHSFSDKNVIWVNLLGLALGFLILLIIRFIGYYIYKKEVMGFGDIKLLAALGFVVGYKKIILVFLLGCLIASLVEVTLMALKVKNKESEIAFGPYLVYGGMISIFYGHELIQAYLSLVMGG